MLPEVVKSLKNCESYHIIFQDYCPDLRKYGKVVPLERSKPKVPTEDLLKASETIQPFPFDKETDMSVGGPIADYWDGLVEKIASIFI